MTDRSLIGEAKTIHGSTIEVVGDDNRVTLGAYHFAADEAVAAGEALVIAGNRLRAIQAEASAPSRALDASIRDRIEPMVPRRSPA